jgi:hypothetical protein
MNGGCHGGTCGRRGQPCCEGGIGCTEAFTICDAGACVSCGGLGEPCCDSASGGALCVAPYACDDPGPTRSCEVCGGLGQPCCAGDLCFMGTCDVSSTDRCH